MYIKIYTQIILSIYSSFIYHLSIYDDTTGLPYKKCHEVTDYLPQRGKNINITILTTKTKWRNIPSFCLGKQFPHSKQNYFTTYRFLFNC